MPLYAPFNGGVIGNPILGPSGIVTAPTYSFSSGTTTGFYLGGAGQVSFASAGVERARFGPGGTHAFSGTITMSALALSSGIGSAGDLTVSREAADIWAQQRGTNAQQAIWTNTFTSSTDREYATADWKSTANLFRLMTVKGSSGGTARAMALGTDNINRILIDALGNVGLNGGNAALGTTATDGFTYIPTCAGTPTGVPTGMTGAVAIVYDTTNDQLYIYRGGWKQPKTPAGAAIVNWQ